MSCIRASQLKSEERKKGFIVARTIRAHVRSAADVALGLLAQSLVLLSQLADQLVERVLVDDCLVLDLLGAVGVAQRGEGLVVVDVGRRESGDHDRLRVAAQRVHKELGEDRVAVGHHHLLLT